MANIMRSHLMRLAVLCMQHFKSFIQQLFDPNQNIVLVPHPCHRPMVLANSTLQRSPCLVGGQPNLQAQKCIQSNRTAITAGLAMNIHTRSRVFQNPFQTRKNITILSTRGWVINAPINVLDVRTTRTRTPSQIIAMVPPASIII